MTFNQLLKVTRAAIVATLVMTVAMSSFASDYVVKMKRKSGVYAIPCEVNGVKLVSAVMPLEPAAAKDLAFKIRAAVEGSLLCVLGTKYQDKPQLTIMMSDDMVSDHSLNAGQMVREAAKLIQGGGGGQPHFAQAGGKNPDGLSAAVDKVIELAKL